ncbi:NAD(P)/FAD-dependent oxidoreductase [Gordonia desulfuricans]|uniref:NAD(P)/FAD-dependent oxidoreductase n=1 Tax=Gordonia desulfuricans TaxID=89051 RepID=A0A7K3LMA6_9ACTN|nr:NAD(P)/FAD-dependent oxidoreductase [Gordonia desulfuricans]NDK89181.1 NAD(P)/FAD-dependent oxidoreductase [Gordonia desulfuricans]
MTTTPATPGTAPATPAGIAVDGLPAEIDVLVVGAGFGGLAALYRLRTDHPGLSVLAVERAAEAGGVWLANTYPGAACDVPTALYSLSFADNPNWSHTFGRQWEIRQYATKVAADYADVIRYDCEMLAAAWDDAAHRWVVDTAHGTIRARFLITAPGALSEPVIPDIPGLDEFTGAVFHTAAWDHSRDLAGRKVAVVGSGASAVQVVPEIVDKVESLVSFQRTPSWVIPRLDRKIGPLERAIYSRFPKAHRAVRMLNWFTHEFHVVGMAHQPAVLRAFSHIANRHRARQISDPALRRRLTPHFTMGCKRILISNKWYPALDHRSTTVTGALQRLTATGAVSADGTEFDVDTVIFATGFEPTSPPLARVITGRDGRHLAQVWNGSPSAYRGVSVPDFPNLFLLYGPNTNLGHSSILLMLESQAYYIGAVLAHLEARRAQTVEVTRSAHDAYNAHLDTQLAHTVWNTGGCGSWYIDATGRNSVMWPTFTSTYRKMMSHFAPTDHVFGAEDTGDRRAGTASLAHPG